MKIKCNKCGREWHESYIRKCPLSGKNICMFCCSDCKNYEKRSIGIGCKGGTKKSELQSIS